MQSPTDKRRVVLPIYPAQRRFLRSNAIFRGFVGGRGSGKSLVGAYDVLRRSKPGCFYFVGGPTYPQLTDTSLRTFLTLARQLDVLEKHNCSSQHAWLRNGAEIVFRSADNPERFRGPNLSGAWLDEAGLMDKAAFETIIGCLREKGQMGWMSATFTPKGKQHWTYEIFGKGAPNTELIHAQTKDNPFLPPEFEETIKQQYGPLLARQELEGSFEDAIGTVFKREWCRYVRLFGEQIQFLDQAGQVTRRVGIDSCRIFATVDLAASLKTTADYTVIAVWADDKMGNLVLLDLIRERMEAPTIVQQLWAVQRRWRPLFFGIESVGTQLLFIQSARANGLPVQELKADRDKLSRAIPATVRASAGQVWFPKDASWLAVFEDELLMFPSAPHDDQVDCLSYACAQMVLFYDVGQVHGDILCNATLDPDRYAQDDDKMQIGDLQVDFSDEPREWWNN